MRPKYQVVNSGLFKFEFIIKIIFLSINNGLKKNLLLMIYYENIMYMTFLFSQLSYMVDYDGLSITFDRPQTE